MNRSRYFKRVAPVLLMGAMVLIASTRLARAQAPLVLVKNLFSHVMKSADVDATFAKLTDSSDVYTKSNHAVTFRVVTKDTGVTNHREADEYWFVRQDSAQVTLAGVPPHAVAGGDVVYVPRGITYSIAPSPRFTYVALRVFAPRPPETGSGAATPAATSYFASKADIDATFARELKSTALRFPGGATVSEIIYNGAIGPYESHERSDQTYFVRYGSGKGTFDGRLVNPLLTGPGQVRGTGVIDGSDYTIAPGDIVFIPRNTVHFVDPGTGKVGYLLVGMPSSQSAFPEPPPDPSRGREFSPTVSSTENQQRVLSA